MTETAKPTSNPSAPSQRCKHTKTVLSEAILVSTHMGPYGLKRRTKNNCFAFIQFMFRHFIACFCKLILFTNTRRGASPFVLQIQHVKHLDIKPPTYECHSSVIV